MDLSPQACYEAVASRDRRFDGRFFTGVLTTGVYCRPGCTARTPLARNVRFYATSAACEAAGFRACRICRPDAAPGTPWSATSATIARALGAIAEGALDEGGLPALAGRLGVGERHLRRLFQGELGASPHALGLARRVHFARTLLDSTDLPITRVALASGFRSIRAFNDAFRKSFGESPSRRRARPRSRRETPRDRLRLELAYRPPLAWPELLAFLRGRAIPGVERVGQDAEGRDVYERTFEVGRARGWLSVRSLDSRHAPDCRNGLDSRNGPDSRNALELEVPASAAPELLAIAERVRRLFDLAADPLAIGDSLSRDPFMARRVEAVPGLRVPGAFEPFELGVRAILGQQVTVKAASGLAGKLARLAGEPLEGAPEGLDRLFPSPPALAAADVASAGMPRARAEAIRGFARAFASGEIALRRGVPFEVAVERLDALPGIGPWTAQYVALRALGEPDAFPTGDLALAKALAPEIGDRPTPRQVTALAERWRPWRAYAALYLWSVP